MDGVAFGHTPTIRTRHWDMSIAPADLDDDALAFLTDRHLATLTTVDTAGRPHAVPVGFTWDSSSGLARIITRGGSVKARRLTATPDSPVTVCQIDGGRWLAMEGTARVTAEPAAVAEAERRYGQRYRTPEPNDQRVVIEIQVTKVLGRW